MEDRRQFHFQFSRELLHVLIDADLMISSAPQKTTTTRPLSSSHAIQMTRSLAKPKVQLSEDARRICLMIAYIPVQ